MTGIGKLCNKCPKWLIKENSSYSDYFNATSGFTSNTRAPRGPVTFSLDISDDGKFFYRSESIYSFINSFFIS